MLFLSPIFLIFYSISFFVLFFSLLLSSYSIHPSLIHHPSLTIPPAPLFHTRSQCTTSPPYTSLHHYILALPLHHHTTCLHHPISHHHPPSPTITNHHQPASICQLFLPYIIQNTICPLILFLSCPPPPVCLLCLLSAVLYFLLHLAVPRPRLLPSLPPAAPVSS